MKKSLKTIEFVCAKPIVLVGIMGAGKTTIGRRLAPKLGLQFVDADEEIEKAAGMSVSELFTLHGETQFRIGEQKVISRLLSGAPIVLATGGGALTTEPTRDLIKELAISVWIKADIDTVLQRALKRGNRPLLKSGDPRETLVRLSSEREQFYAQADIHVETQPGPHSKTVDVIVSALHAFVDAEHQAGRKHD